MSLIWGEQLSVGNAMLDSEHKGLIDMVNSIEYMIGTRDTFAFLGAIKLFKDALDAHFANEARFAQAFNFNFGWHELMHRIFQDELQQKMGDLYIKFDAWPVLDGYPQYLGDWLTGHITGEDMKMKPMLLSRPYHFKPA